MNPGIMDRYVSVMTPTAGKTKAGASTRTWTHDHYSFMARQSSGSGEERIINGRTAVPKQYTYTGHLEGDIDETMRLQDAGKSYNILSVDEVERGMFIELLVEEVLE